ncbi:SusC/RagA family TonB-linked outer membrane protein [Niabella ginsengisoli]|uniref:TonB-dependent receptor n=1 Tax=Niabella ginsengisoli TaxID=522298 RepID=A0ABS9SKM3_9BACT|nr:TonB-dependent receptor [Niabella ginsengisoli]MCH5598934.1 TonB-dependent receptor [Niabella ginsengisoli]
MTVKILKLISISYLLLALIAIPPDAAAQISTQQQSEITANGSVMNDKGEPLNGVSVSVKGTNKATSTNSDGVFSIKCNAGDTLLFSYVGFVDIEVAANAASPHNIIMQTDTKLMGEVVVIGYGTTTRKNVIGAIDQITSKAIENRPVANLTQALQGASPNLIIQQRSMNPNDNTLNINIRGIKTTTNNTPLVIIDGVISDVGNMNKLNPNDVANISVLKDAGSAAIYGSRSASGVILITTKQGAKNSKPKVRVGGSVGVQTPDILYQPLDGWQNATMLNVALANGGKTPAFTPAQIQDLKDQGDAEWMMDYIFKDALQQSYDVSISGGSANTTYMVSGGYYDQKSNFIGPGYGIKRYNLRSKLTTEFKRLKVNVILGYARNDIKGDEANGGFKIADASRTPKYYYNAPKTADGRYIISSIGVNAAAPLELGGYNRHNNDWLNINTSFDFKITNDLKARALFGADITNNWRFIRRLEFPLYNSPEDTEPARFENTNRETENYALKGAFINAQFLLDYNKQLGKHTIAALAGVSQEVLTNRGIDVKTSFTDPDLGIPISDGDEETIFNNSRTEVNGTLKRVIQSGFGRLNYNYDDRYYAEFTIRADGSSRFPANNRWGTFPSVSLGWRLSEESFLESYSQNIGDLKLRGSWGILGNQEIADFQYFTTYTVYTNAAGFNNNGVSGTGFQGASPDLRWEKVNTSNIGLDMTFLKNALSVNLDYFYQKTNDILRRLVVPSVYGTQPGDMNIGTMENRGWEATINYRLRTSAFNHAFSFNIGNTQNKVVDLGFEEIITSDNIGYITRAGLPIGAYYGLKTDGFFQSYTDIENAAIPIGVTPQPGDVKFVDRNDDGVIDDRDRYCLGDAFPHYTFGFTYNVDYKGFDLSMLIQGVGSRKQSLRGDIYVPFHHGAWYPVMFKHQLDTWTTTNTDARYPRLSDDASSSYSNNWGRGSDIFILDGKYLRLKNLQLGYTLPANLVERMGIGSIRAYVTAQNLFTLSNNSFIDPESSEFDNNMRSSGANSGRNYPTLKYYGFGINMEF